MAVLSRDNVETVTELYARVADQRQGKHGQTRVVRLKVNGRPQLWKTRPNDFRLPVKYGLRDTFSVYPAEAEFFFTTADEAENGPRYS